MVGLFCPQTVALARHVAMGLLESKHKEPENMQLFFFDVYRNTVGLVSGPAHDALRLRNEVRSRGGKGGDSEDEAADEWDSNHNDGQWKNSGRTASWCHACQQSHDNCNYTCHPQCQNLVKLDCKKQLIDSPETEVIEEKCEDPESSSVSEFCFSQDELRQRIDVYNATVQGEEFRMTLLEDCETFRGFIRVHMNLCRPINVVAGTRPPSLYDIIYDDEESTEKTLTSFYLPRNTVKALHINSTTTTQEVISALLKKFKVVDNPRKFALYERCYESGETFKAKMRRLQDHEKPLILALFWGSEEITNKRFILQENDTGDVSWEQFTYPELRNFLLILNREEEEYLNQVRLKYQLLGSKIKEAMDSFNYPELAQEAAASSHTEADSLDLQATLPIQNFPDTFHQWDSEDGRPPSVASSRTLDSVHSLASSSSTSTANTMLRRPQTLMSPKRMQTSVSVLKNSNKKDSNLICSSIHTSTYQQPKHNV